MWWEGEKRSDLESFCELCVYFKGAGEPWRYVMQEHNHISILGRTLTVRRRANWLGIIFWALKAQTCSFWALTLTQWPWASYLISLCLRVKDVKYRQYHYIFHEVIVWVKRDYISSVGLYISARVWQKLNICKTFYFVISSMTKARSFQKEYVEHIEIFQGILFSLTPFTLKLQCYLTFEQTSIFYTKASFIFLIEV